MLKFAIFVLLVCVVHKSNAVCTEEDFGDIADELEDLFNTLHYVEQEGRDYAYHGFAHGQMFEKTLTWMLENVFTAKDESLQPALLKIAALYHDSGYPRSKTKKFAQEDKETYLGRGHGKESAKQLLDHLRLIQKYPQFVAKQDCFQLKYIFPMLMLIQSTCVFDAVVVAGGAAKNLLPQGEPTDDEKKKLLVASLLVDLQAGIVATQACKVWTEWYNEFHDFQLSGPLDASFCEGASATKLPGDLTQAVITTLFHLARSDFGHLHQPGAICWSANLLKELFEQCNGISCIVRTADDSYGENETPEDREGRLTKYFFKDQAGFLNLPFVKWPANMLDKTFVIDEDSKEGKTREHLLKVTVSHAKHLANCLHLSKDADVPKHLEKLLGSDVWSSCGEGFEDVLEPPQSRGRPVCVEDKAYRAWLPFGFKLKETVKPGDLGGASTGSGTQGTQGVQREQGQQGVQGQQGAQGEQGQQEEEEEARTLLLADLGSRQMKQPPKALHSKFKRNYT